MANSGKERNRQDIDKHHRAWFERQVRWECDYGVGKNEYVACGRTATHIVRWYEEDGVWDCHLACREHAVEQKEHWSGMDWDSEVEMTTIEAWDISVSYAGQKITRVGGTRRGLKSENKPMELLELVTDSGKAPSITFTRRTS